MKRILFFIITMMNIGGAFAQSDTIIYSFFTAGHTYGSPNSPHYGLHYPFVDYITNINNYPTMELGFLTGDVVVSSTPAYWDSAQADLDDLTMPIHIAAGNHDMGQEFVNRFGDYYYSFVYKNDLIIVLTPGLDSWNISGQQLEFLESTLISNHSNVNNVFIFLHELIWWSPENQYQDVEINYEPYYPGSTNFDTVIKPLLLSYSNNITVYAGDLGCTDDVSPFMYHHFNNITLIGSGMGGGIRDNIVVTDVYNDSVHYNLVAINGSDPNALGYIYSFSLNTVDTIPDGDIIDVYPNPSVGGHFYLKNDSSYSISIRVFDMHGNLVLSDSVNNNTTSKIRTTGMKPGVYSLYISDSSVVKKIVIH